MTNAVPFLDQVVSNVNWTVIIALIPICLTGMVAFINIYKSKKKINDDDLNDSNLFKTLSNNSEKLSLKQEVLKDTVSKLHTEVEKLKVEMGNSKKSVDDLRKDNREMLKNLSELIQQIQDLIGI